VRRAELTEIHEQAWFPSRLRDDVTDTLQFVFDTIRIYQPIAGKLASAIRASKTSHVVDLCSGAGGPWFWLREMISRLDHLSLQVVLTDRYPNQAALRRIARLSSNGISYSREPVDAQHIPPALAGFRTIFSSLHHLTSGEVVATLRDAAAQGQGIGFFEAAKRRPRTMFYACFMPLATWALMPFMRPFRFMRLVWTYLLPVIPFVLMYDGVVSCMRAYSHDELRDFSARVGAQNYAWEIGEAGAVTYFLGYPSSSS
jgi:hypothetical protein